MPFNIYMSGTFFFWLRNKHTHTHKRKRERGFNTKAPHNSTKKSGKLLREGGVSSYD